jgi:hypothetical protein
MKNLTILIFLAVYCNNTPAFAQTKSQDIVIEEPPQPSVFKRPIYIEPVYKQVDTYPVYTGGFGAL